MKALSIEHADKSWQQLLAGIEAGETLTLTRAGTVIAYITPAKRPQHWAPPLGFGETAMRLHEGELAMSGLISPLD